MQAVVVEKAQRLLLSRYTASIENKILLNLNNIIICYLYNLSYKFLKE